MRFAFLLIAILLQTPAWCQNNILEFFPLNLIDSISEGDVNSFIKVDSLKNSNYFFTESYKENYGLFFFKMEREKWSVYDFELYLLCGRNTIIDMIKQENKQFVSVQSLSNPSGVCESNYGRILLIDVLKNEFSNFYNYAQNKCYEENGDVSISECKVKFFLKNNSLKILSTKNRLSDCLESGTYKYNASKFVKMK